MVHTVLAVPGMTATRLAHGCKPAHPVLQGGEAQDTIWHAQLPPNGLNTTTLINTSGLQPSK
jgi:hypothetical protein